MNRRTPEVGHDTNYDPGFYDKTRQYYADGLPAWRWFVLERLHARSLLDLGTGLGGWLEPLLGDIPVLGVDWLDEATLPHLRIPQSSFVNVDLRSDVPNGAKPGSFTEHWDVCMSLEAMEHLANVHEANFLDCLLAPKPRMVVLSCGSGQGTYDPTRWRVNRLGERVLGGEDWKPQFGTHHVNCQPVGTVIRKMWERGYGVDIQLSREFSSLTVPAKRSGRKWAFAGFYRRNTRIYRRLEH